MAELDLITLDRDIAIAAIEARKWRRLLRTDVPAASEHAWFEAKRYVTTRSTFQELGELDAGHPLREPLRRWVYALAMTRIVGPQMVRVAASRQARHVRLEEPEAGTYSVREITDRFLAEPVRAKKRAWLAGLTAHAEPVAVLERELGHARIEVSSRLGVTSPLEMAPYEPGTLFEAARDLLERSDDLARAFFGASGDFADLVELFLAREVRGVWPAQPSQRWLYDLFEGTPLLEGLSPDVGPLPPPLGASSFARALARFGAAYARAAAAGRRPFVLASDPDDAHARRRGGLFASLVWDPIFLQRKLGFSRDASNGVARALARTVLGAVRLEATHTLLDLALAPAAEVSDALHRALSVPVPRALSAVLPRPDPDAGSRLAASLLSALDRDALVERFDEDWFRNPRALAELRGADGEPRPLRLGAEAFSGAAERLTALLGKLGG